MKKVNNIIDQPIKATLFGKFYEKIILGWFQEKGLFKPFEGKPRVYWKDVEAAGGGSAAANRLNKALSQKKRENQWCTPDGFLQRDGIYYVWEAKNWPLWSEGKKPLDQLKDLLLEMPLILATKVVYRQQEYELSGMLFSWWSEPRGANSLVKEINDLIAPRTFEIFFTAEILDDCISQKHIWYLEIIEEQKRKTDEFFTDLLD